MQIRSISTLAFVAVTVVVSPAAAHYLWVTVDAKKGEHGTVNVYFEHSAAPGDGKYLDPFVANGTTWVRTVEAPKAKELNVKDTKAGKQRWLSGPCTASGPRSIDSYSKFGVYSYPNAEVLLHYYGRLVEVSNQAELKTLARAQQMNLDIAPLPKGDKIELTVLFENKPAANRVVVVRGPKQLRFNLKTDADGKTSFENKGGRHTLRVSVDVKEGGKDGGREYEFIRHTATMIVDFPTK